MLDLLASSPEHVDFEASSTEMRAAGPLPAVPTVVITRGWLAFPPLEPTQATEDLRQEAQRDLASRIPGARLVVAEQSDHDIPLAQPDLVADAIHAVVTAAREPATWATPAA